MDELREALTALRERGVKLEDPGDEISPEAPGSPHVGRWFHDPDGYRWELSVQNGVRENEISVSSKRSAPLGVVPRSCC
jgi:hypothetical protein